MTTLFPHDLTPDPDWHVAAVRLWNYKAAADVRLELGKRLHVFIGDNGAGKTTILDGIAAGLAGVVASKVGASASKAALVKLDQTDVRRQNGRMAPLAAVVLRVGPRTCVVQEEVNDPTVPLFSTDPFEPPALAGKEARVWFSRRWNDVRQGLPEVLPVLAYYTADRTDVVETAQADGDGPPERTAALQGAFWADTSYRDLVAWFATMERDELYEMRRRNDLGFRDPHVEAVREAVRRMVPGVTHVGFNTTWSMLEAEVETPAGTDRFTVDDLSGGGRVMLALAADLARRMVQANPDLGLDSPAIVLIDEIDLHLHPRWQAHVIDDLLRTFPKAQFIVTTHSEQIIGAVPSDLVTTVRVEHDGIHAYRVDHAEGATYDRILEEEMGLGRRRNKEHQDLLDEYWALVDAGDGEMDAALQLRARLNDLFPGGEPELARADIVIRRLAARKGAS